MGEQIRNNVRERYLDLLDWVDIRPDINWPFWCAGFVGLLAMLVYYLPPGILAIAVFMGVGAAVGLAGLGIAIALVCVTGRAIYEAILGWSRDNMVVRPQRMHQRRLQ
jgi:hypothetical protein